MIEKEEIAAHFLPRILEEKYGTDLLGAPVDYITVDSSDSGFTVESRSREGTCIETFTMERAAEMVAEDVLRTNLMLSLIKEDPKSTPQEEVLHGTAGVAQDASSRSDEESGLPNN